MSTRWLFYILTLTPVKSGSQLLPWHVCVCVCVWSYRHIIPECLCHSRRVLLHLFLIGKLCMPGGLLYFMLRCSDFPFRAFMLKLWQEVFNKPVIWFFFFFLLPISNFANMSELSVFELRCLSWKLLYIKHLKYSPAFGQLARPLFEKSLALQLNNRLYTNLRASVLPTYLQPLCNCPPCQ